MRKKFAAAAALFFAALFLNGSPLEAADDNAAPGETVAAVPQTPAVSVPEAEGIKFYPDVQSIDDLDLEDVTPDVPVEDAEVDGVKVVYRTPDSCREFSVYLENKRAKLKALEDEIARKEFLLKRMKTEFETLMGRYVSVEKQVRELIQRDPSNLKDNPELAKMIKLYETLAPEDAAARLRNLDLDFTLALLKGMKPKKLGQILSAMEPKLAAALSSQMVRGF